MIVRGAFNHLLRPGLRRDFRDSYDQHEEEWSRIVRSGSMDRAEVEAVTMSGLPRQVALGEGESYTIVDPVLSDKVVYTDTQWGLAFGVTKEMMEDDLYGKANGSARWLARSVRLAQEYEVADMLDDAFTGNTFTGFAGESLISASHSLLASNNTASNLITGNPELGVTGLQLAFEIGEQTVDHQGDPIPVRIDTLIVNISDEWAAIQLTQNDAEPYTANRNVNATRRKRQLSYMVSHYKDQSGSDWFARDSQVYDAHLLFKVRPEMPDWYDEPTRTAYYASRQRFLTYFYDWRGFLGSNAA